MTGPRLECFSSLKIQFLLRSGHTGNASVVLLGKVLESKNKEINSPWGVVVFSHLDKRPKAEAAAGNYGMEEPPESQMGTYVLGFWTLDDWLEGETSLK